ncbi:MAG: O-antigen ligase family protein [Actinomycetota bacterium]|nr:O-antigen ligase family protein [Actinomycetota bacterium]
MREKIELFGDTGNHLWGAGRKEGRNKGRRPSQLLAPFKAVALLALLAATAYGMLHGGLYAEDLWLPVAAGVLALLLVTLFVRGFYRDVPQAGWVMFALLAALVGVKVLSVAWTISEAETIREILRSSMYLAAFLIALAALASARQVGPLVDLAILMVTAVAGYGLLQRINPVEYPITSLGGVRIDSTLGYGNTFAIMLGMGVVMVLARMTAGRNAALRGLYATLALGFLVALYLTFSRGGIGSLGVGLVSLLALTRHRLQMLANLLLLCAPGAWLLWRIQDLDGLTRVGASEEQKLADGAAFSTDLIWALMAAFVLQAGYAFLVNRYELMPAGRRVLGACVLFGAVLVTGAGTFAAVNGHGGIGQAYETLVSNPNRTENVAQRLASLGLGYREDYWRVGWEAWKEHPLTGTGAGTFQYVWLENRPGTKKVLQVHNLYLEQGTETGVFAFLALVGFVVTLVGYSARATWRSQGGERQLLLAGLVSALVVYLVSSFFEWHWYIPASTLFFFLLAAITAKFACRDDWDVSGPETRSAEDHPAGRR